MKVEDVGKSYVFSHQKSIGELEGEFSVEWSGVHGQVCNLEVKQGTSTSVEEAGNWRDMDTELSAHFVQTRTERYVCRDRFSSKNHKGPKLTEYLLPANHRAGSYTKSVLLSLSL